MKTRLATSVLCGLGGAGAAIAGMIYWPVSLFSTTVSTLALVAAVGYAIFRFVGTVSGPGKDAPQWASSMHSSMGWTLLTISGVLALGHLTKPSGPIDGVVRDQIIAEAITPVIQSFGIERDAETLYIRIGSTGDPSDDILATLSMRNIEPMPLPWSQRPSVDECKSEVGLIYMGVCKRDDFVGVSDLKMAFWKVSRVEIETAACRATAVVVKFLGRWRMVALEWKMCI